jgi:pimeloyl-ACP methyl ester carboxylesterase
MVVRLTRILLAIQLLAAAGICLLLVRYAGIGSYLLAAVLAIAIVLLIRLAITANNFGLSWVYRSETPLDHRLGRLAAARLFLLEYCASMTTSSWTMGFCTFRDRPGKAGTAPVLLVHGYGCNSGYWHSMSRVLSRAGIGHYGIDLEPMLASIEQFVPALHARIEEICRQTGQDQIVIVAHSMGGLVARAYLRDHGAHRVRRVITLGTPHRGTGLARFGAGENVREMLWTGSAENGRCSDWLEGLARDEDLALRPLFVSIFSHQDNIVSPQMSSHLPGARNIEFNGIGHVALGLHPRIQQEVMAAISSAPAPGRSQPSV